MEWLQAEYWDIHGWIFLLGCIIFPRLTLLFSGVVTGGFTICFSWFFMPHILVAILSLSYWSTNPLLVIAAWICAIIGTMIEGTLVKNF